MHYRRALLARLRPGDRLAVTLLRGGDCPKATQAIRDAFAALRECAAEAGLVILERDALAVGASEFVLLGWLALWQRERVEPAIEHWRVPIGEVQRCAQLLDTIGCRIDYSYIVHIHGDDSARLVRASADGAKSGSAVEDAYSGACPLRHRLLSELAERGPMRTAELEQLGVSRQMLSGMVKRGFVKRIRFGLYSL